MYEQRMKNFFYIYSQVKNEKIVYCDFLEGGREAWLFW